MIPLQWIGITMYVSNFPTAAIYIRVVIKERAEEEME